MSRKKLDEIPPILETNYVGFRSENALFSGPFKADMIRCNDKYAILDSGNGSDAYLLIKNRRKTRHSNIGGGTLFHLVLKFPCDRIEPLSKKETLIKKPEKADEMEEDCSSNQLRILDKRGQPAQEPSRVDRRSKEEVDMELRRLRGLPSAPRHKIPRPPGSHNS